MELSQDTLQFMNFLDEYSKNSLRKRNDIGVIFEVAASYQGGAELLNKLIFSGKSIYNVYKTLKKIDSNDDGIRLLEKELERNIEEIRTQLLELTQFFDDELKIRFNDIYLEITAGTLKNIIDLAHDLGIIKNLQNDSKHKK